ncbi:hypothetical protein H5410_017096 [Solanum commersonii]|uniref:Uncharacterized protein n=1 Tax=Solanum commersonii TaxID=4109 RepID=A0A9J5ZYF0_SOLCO|nr:hypothetical protein H5410_017096 [Solanum commersonii]
MALQKLQGSFLNDFKCNEAYTNELRLSNPGSDIADQFIKGCIGTRDLGRRDEETASGSLEYLRGRFQGSIECTRASKSVAKDLLKYPPRTYEARGKPILKMLEDIRIKIMNVLREEEDASKWTTDYSPKCMKLFNAYMRIAQLCSVDFNGDLGYGVRGEDRYTMNSVEKNAYVVMAADRHSMPSCHQSYVVLSAPRPTQDEEYHSMSSLQYEPFGPARELESDPDIRPQVISENRTKLKMRMNQQRATENRVISFRGNHAGISEHTDLPYSPTNLTWKGKEVVTGNQLERERQKVDKLKTRKTNGKSHI